MPGYRTDFVRVPKRLDNEERQRYACRDIGKLLSDLDDAQGRDDKAEAVRLIDLIYLAIS